jgi:hypothetical protein
MIATLHNHLWHNNKTGTVLPDNAAAKNESIAQTVIDFSETI